MLTTAGVGSLEVDVMDANGLDFVLLPNERLPNPPNLESPEPKLNFPSPAAKPKENAGLAGSTLFSLFEVSGVGKNVFIGLIVF